MFKERRMRFLGVVYFAGLLIFLIASCGPSRNQGAYLYERECSSCHMPDGSGLGALYPPLANSDYLRENQGNLACIIKYGISDTMIVNGIQYDMPMEGIKKLNEVEITNIINYINTAWNNQIAEQKLEDISAQLKKCN